MDPEIPMNSMMSYINEKGMIKIEKEKLEDRLKVMIEDGLNDCPND